MEINCDLGEGSGNDRELFPFIHAANIACGLHAGSALEMAEAVLLARTTGVKVGAHPSWDDRENFGRTEMTKSREEVMTLIAYQLGALDAICRQLNYPMSHVKPHGALYNQAGRDPQIAEAIIDAILDFNPGLELYALSNSVLARLGKTAGLTIKQEAFADRRYSPTGELAGRQNPNALLRTTKDVMEQVKNIVLNKKVWTTENTWIPLTADTICIHSDGITAVELAKNIHLYLKQLPGK